MKRILAMILAATAFFVATPASAQLPRTSQCLAVTMFDAKPCGKRRHGLYIDKTSGDLHWLKQGTEWFEFSTSGTTLTLGGSGTATILNFDDNITMDGTLAVTGATTLSGSVSATGAYLESPAYSITATGAPGLATLQKDGTVVDLTANVLNEMHYSTWQLNFGVIVQGGAGTPDASPTGAVGSPPDGLNIGGATSVVTNGDNWEIWGGTLGAVGRPMVVGTDAAFQACWTVYVEDVSGSDATYCGWREATAAPVAAGSYADFGAVGHIAGQYGTLDEGGATDSGSDAIADTETDIWCVYVGATGVVTYTVDGAAPTTPGAQTLTDGLLVVPFCNLLHDADKAEDTVISNWTVSYQ